MKQYAERTSMKDFIVSYELCEACVQDPLPQVLEKLGGKKVLGLVWHLHLSDVWTCPTIIKHLSDNTSSTTNIFVAEIAQTRRGPIMQQTSQTSVALHHTPDLFD